MVNTAFTVLLLLRKLTRKPAVKSASTNCYVPSIKSMYTGSMMLLVFFAGKDDDFTPTFFTGCHRNVSRRLRFRLYTLPGTRLA
ncbi:hypothetical protein RCT98_19915 [Escherichia marmotae]|nr:hypothetical protein [Escherichia marmotae]MEC9607104.1 hypothetical protein [Escherichia marmotae]MEC9825095.1 hypothetical protein [Escherichia marmotae]MED0235528.1 hypothetical protein [Escherichia marmotae]MED0331421.1 hypothetical protein [Escherichia marmotae]MED0542030.1 hypothetical protein [Escherichia marmotae]